MIGVQSLKLETMISVILADLSHFPIVLSKVEVLTEIFVLFLLVAHLVTNTLKSLRNN